ncbi:MAG: DUF3307 domain-containing protein [Elusimicrobiales bacterium]
MMEIFWRLLLSHFIADFTLQTNWINRIKREKTIGILVHVLIHLLTTYSLLYPYLSKTWFNRIFNGYLIIFIICLLHFAVDQIRVYIIKKEVYPDNTLNFLVDQFFHLYFVFIFSPFTNVPTDFSGERIVMILLFLAIVSHTTTVFIYYIEKDLTNASFPSFDQKYLMIFERIVLFGVFMIEGRIWYIVAVLWIAQLYYIKRKKITDISWINFVISIIMSFVCGLLSRYYYYGGI